jgi:hypothetical protein
MGAVGDELLGVTHGAQRELVLAAPYIKASALRRLVGDRQVPTKIVTRWRLDELAMGVSDLDVWNVAQVLDAELWLNPTLHAKYYRVDDQILIGSANLTGAGMGWSSVPNLETLLNVTSLAEQLAEFEVRLFENAVKVDEGLYNTFLRDLLEYEPITPKNIVNISAASGGFSNWRPQLRYPADLFSLYDGRGGELTNAGRETAQLDLVIFDLPAGLDERRFNLLVASQLRLHPELRALDRAAQITRRFGEMRRLLASRGAKDPSRDWQTWIRWIDHFLSTDYQIHTARYSEIFSRRNPSPTTPSESRNPR